MNEDFLTSEQQAIADGTLIPYQFPYHGEMIDCCFGRRLWEKYRYNQMSLKEICRCGMRLLGESDKANRGGRWLFAISSKIWMINDAQELIFLRPEDLADVFPKNQGRSDSIALQDQAVESQTDDGGC